MCCNVLQRVAVWYKVLQCVVMCCSVLQWFAVYFSGLQLAAGCCSVLPLMGINVDCKCTHSVQDGVACCIVMS